MRKLIDRDDAVSTIIKLAENLPESLRSHTIFVALYLNNPNDFPIIMEVEDEQEERHSN